MLLSLPLVRGRSLLRSGPPRLPLLLAFLLASITTIASAASIDPLLARYAQARQRSDVTAMASATARDLPPLPGGIESEGGQEWVDVLVRGSASAAAIEALGGRVRTVAGEVMTVRVPLTALQGLISAVGVEELALAQPVEFQTDRSIPAIGAPQAWGGPPPTFSPDGVTGSGVLVGVVDTGLDCGHADLRTDAGTRILYLWDQTFGLGAPPPAGFAYGSEYATAAINAGQYPGGDSDGHGTHITGIAAGNGRATGNGKPRYTYMGVAPESNLIVVELVENSNGQVTDDKIIDGVNYVFQKAAALHKPAVVLLASGKLTGPHDGQDPLDLALAGLTGSGKIIVAAAGNYGNTARHAEWTATASGQTGEMTLSFGSYTPGPTAAEHVYSEAWYNAAANFSVSAVTPAGLVVGPVARGAETTVNTPSGIVQISNGKYTSANGSYRVNFYIYRGNTSLPPVASGIWTYRFKSAASGTQRADMWLTDYALGAVTAGFVQGKTFSRLVVSPATANNVIAVAAYSTKADWTDVTGAGRFYPTAVENAIADFSSPGPRRDGVQVPHITAPGYGVAAALSSQKVPSTMWIVPDGVHRMDHGTSAAAAHVAGVVALMLEKGTTLTPAAALLQLQQNAFVDSWTGPVPNALWGSGKLRVPGTSPVAVGDGTAAPFGFAAPYPNPTRSGVSFEFALSATDLAPAAGGVRLRIVDVRGREVASIAGRAEAGPQRLSWDGQSAARRPVAAGVYFAHLEVGQHQAVKKFVRLQ